MENNKTRFFLRVGCVVVFFTAAVVISILLQTKYDMGPSPFDLYVQKFFFSLRGAANNAVIFLTHCGDTVTIIALCAFLLILPNRLKYGVPVSLAALGGVAIYKPMKHLFLRARPDVSLHLVEQGGYSFPSGHSVTSIIVYGLLIYLLHKHCKNDVLRTSLSWLCLLLALFIGPSRIFVGVHWPTDVLCGWLIGGAVLIIAITIIERRSAKNENL